MFIKVYLMLCGKNTPYSNIKFTAHVQKRSFNIFLNNTRFLSSIELKYNRLITIENVNSSPLISTKGLNKPYILATMLHWCTLISSTPLFNIIKSLPKYIYLIIIPKYKRSRCGIKYIITSRKSFSL